MEKLIKETNMEGNYTGLTDVGVLAMGGGIDGRRSRRRDWSSSPAIRADILANRTMATTGIENIERSISDGRQADLIVNGNERVCNNVNLTSSRHSDEHFRSELRGSDQHAGLIYQLTTDAKAAALCCCEAKLQAERHHSEAMAKMEALAKEVVAHDRDKAERELMAIKYAGHHPHPG